MFIFVLSFFAVNLFAQDENLGKIEVIHEGSSNALVDFVPSVLTLKQNDLRKRRESTIGDTLKNESGVQTTSFGPNASRPIIRGLDGGRIRVLQNGLGVLDASTQSVDHAVPVDTLIIDSIEVVRGPMSMLYGSSAVGGVVNINTNRIHSKYEQGAIQELQLGADSSQNALISAAKIDYGSDSKWMFHVDASYRNANDLIIPGNEASKRASADQVAAHDGEGKLANSGSVQKTVGVGLSKVFNRGYMGMSYFSFDNFYGAVAEKTVDIKMNQDRLEFHGEYFFKGDFFKSVRFKTAQSDYGHKEIDGGVIGTTFSNEGNESRLEFMNQMGNIKGISGVQTQFFNFSAVGDEAFLPMSNNRNLSAFTLQDFTNGKDVFSFGARIENTVVENLSSGGITKIYNGQNGSLGLRHQFSETHTASISLSYTERLPNFQELFALKDTIHVATGTSEEGNSSLSSEKAYAVDFGLNYNSTDTTAAFNLYAQQFKDYISLSKTNRTFTDPEGNDFDVYEYQQVDAVFYGFEFDAKKKLDDSPLCFFTKADLVRAKNKNSGDYLPRISPPRLTVGLEMVKDRVSYDVEAQYNFEQSYTAPNETRTDAFTLLNAGISYDVIKNSGKWNFFARLKNILNQEARLHTSTLKDIAPLAGRNIVAGTQYNF